uniref:J domain-containing protein n=1 Tax=Neobodo designis TaxID=312471 RepID=A0A7S1QSA4_NEODS
MARVITAFLLLAATACAVVGVAAMDDEDVRAHLAVLGLVEANATVPSVNAQFRKLMKQDSLHPDVNGGESAGMRRLKEAREAVLQYWAEEDADPQVRLQREWRRRNPPPSPSTEEPSSSTEDDEPLDDRSKVKEGPTCDCDATLMPLSFPDSTAVVAYVAAIIIGWLLVQRSERRIDHAAT